MIGRKNEENQLEHILKKGKPSFIAITGRRRIGKTYLIDQYYKKQICFKITGLQHGKLNDQLKNFTTKLAEYSKFSPSSRPKNWQDALIQLKKYLLTLDKRTKKVIFIDELPWIATARTNFLQLLAHLWNDYLSKEKHFILVICGSASSWLSQKIVNDKGGLHNRLTDTIKLNPFNLSETKLFLKSLNLNLNQQEVSKLYMTFGGVPYYLEQIKKGENSSTAIDRICFSDTGPLKNEYDNLYKALFKNADNHEAVVEALTLKSIGLTRAEIIKKSKIKKGGVYTRTMEDLILSGFVTEFIPFGRKKRGVMYRLNDEFTLFYHRFMKKNKKYTSGMWNQISTSQPYKIWAGYAFENICFNHLDELKKALGITAVYTEISSYRSIGTKHEKGFQIDLLMDRNDNVINLCEIKFLAGPLRMDKKYAAELIDRRQRFIEESKTKKQVFITLITNHKLIENEYSIGVVDNEINLSELY